jgi:hypothetical protein
MSLQLHGQPVGSLGRDFQLRHAGLRTSLGRQRLWRPGPSERVAREVIFSARAGENRLERICLQ